ncbi:transposase [Zymomonas sp.]|uniref:transposase n=1 Tax=Zymomonas sp. TaxID=2068624 RepID=UPI0025CEA457|nr:transposase [Zymomonas sp.]MCA1956597.1 transposase [Zymomonas sp.]
MDAWRSDGRGVEDNRGFSSKRTRPQRAPRKSNRLFLNGMLYVLRTGCPWRDMHEEIRSMFDFVGGRTGCLGHSS